MPAGSPPALRGFYRAITEMDRIDLVARLTLVYLLLVMASTFVWYLHVPLIILVTIAVLVPCLARDPRLWLLLTVICAIKVIGDWASVDNHYYLVGYWCLALFCSLQLRESDAALAVNGRLLIGLAFAFALLWKVGLSPDFNNGTCFRDLLLTEHRFHELSAVGGMSEDAVYENRLLLRQLKRGAVDEGTMQMSDGLVGLARIVTLWTAVIEGLIVALFLWPPSHRFSRLRHAALLVFCWTTYPFGTVVGFGWILTILGLAQCEPEMQRTRFAYLLTFFLILVYSRTPLSTWLMSLLG